jgi:hypothetical protein
MHNAYNCAVTFSYLCQCENIRRGEAAIESDVLQVVSDCKSLPRDAFGAKDISISAVFVGSCVFISLLASKSNSNARDTKRAVTGAVTQALGDGGLKLV